MQGSVHRRFRATVHYDGSDFYGWQLQPDRRTVQGSLEDSLGRLLGEPVRVHAAGRTDRGVHAVGQEVAFDLPVEARDRWTGGELRRALNAVLPADLWIENLARASSDFHPRFDATARRYLYLVGRGERALSPLRRGRIWATGEPLERRILDRLAELLPGERSFSAFARSGQPERGTRCRVERAAWSRGFRGDLGFTVVADRFLHRMVRYLVATMVECASGRRHEEEMAALLEKRDDVRPPRPAPPEGLYLTGVRYPTGWNRRGGVPGLWEPRREQEEKEDETDPDPIQGNDGRPGRGLEGASGGPEARAGPDAGRRPAGEPGR